MTEHSPLTATAEQVCRKRYFKKDKDGNLIENWDKLVQRVVDCVCADESENFKKSAYDLLYSTKFLPNSPCLVNASTTVNGLLACFVTQPPGDSWEEMCRNVAYFGHIARRGGGCFHEDSCVLTSCGPRNIKEIHEGDTVASFNLQTKKPEWSKVTKTHTVDLLTNEIVELKFNPYHKIVCSNYHPFFVIGYDEIIEKQADELVCDDYVIIGHRTFEPFDLSQKHWLQGLIIADGHIDDNQNRLRISGDNLDIIKYANQCLHECYDAPLYKLQDYTSKKGVYELCCCNSNIVKSVTKDVEYYGNKTYTCKIPKNIWQSNRIEQLSFLSGLIDGDGHVCSSGKITIYTASQLMMLDLRQFLSNLGLRNSCRLKQSSKSPNPGWEITILDNTGNFNFVHSYKNKRANIGNRKSKVIIPRKLVEILYNKSHGTSKRMLYSLWAQEHDNICVTNHKKWFQIIGAVNVSDNMLKTMIEYAHLGCIQVKDIKQSDIASQTFYDLTVSPNNNYFVSMEGGFILTHNCGVDFSLIRPSGDPVFGSTHAKACGPIEHMRVVSEAMSSITQAGFRGMACVPGDTMVSTDQGFIRIDKIVQEQLMSNIHTQFGESKITAAWNNGKKEVFEIITEKGYRVKATADHLVYVIDTYNGKNHRKLSKKINQIGKWKRVDELDQNDCLIVNMDEKPFGTCYKQVDGVTLDENVAALVAYAKCDGCLSEHKGYPLLQLVLDSQESIHFFTNNSFHGMEIDTKPQPGEEGTTRLQKSGKSVEFLHKFGEYYTYHCDVPEAIFSSPKSVIAAFLKSAFDAEGTVDVSSNRCRVVLGMNSIEFIESVQNLLGMFGIQSSLRRDISHVNKDGVLSHNMHYLSISSKWHVKKFMDEIGFFSAKKHAAAEKALYNMRFSESGRGNGKASKIIQRITSINSIGDMEVYDISTSNQSFLANNIVVHNCMGTMRVDHPDVFKFITCKQYDNSLKTLLKEDIFNHYDQLKDGCHEHLRFVLDKFISNFNISVVATDKFMQAVQDDADFDLTFGGKTYQTVKARDIFDKIALNAWNNGDPGLLFYDSMNAGPYKHSGQTITATNPCVVAGSLVATQKGWIPVENVEEGDLIWSRNSLYPVKTKEINHNCDVYRVEFTDGDHIDVTAAHRFKCVVSKKYEYRRLDELCEGAKVLVEPVSLDDMEQNPILSPKSLGNLHLLEAEQNISASLTYDADDGGARDLGLIVGSVIGDGCFTESINRYRVYVAFGHEESEWQSIFQSLLNQHSIKHRIEEDDATNRVTSNVLGHLLEVFGVKRNKAINKIIPESMMQSNNKDLLIGLLDGLFSTDGNMYLKEDNPMLRLSSASLELCRQVRRILLGFGIHAKIYKSDRKKHIYQDPKYGAREISSKNPKYDVVLMNEGITKFHHYVSLSNPNKEEKVKQCVETYHYNGPLWTTAIRSITKLDGKHTVYDLYNEETDEWNVNGYVQKGCGEQILPSFGSCNLGSIDVSKFYSPSTKTVNWKDLRSTIQNAVRFLDNVIGVNKFPTKEFETWAKDNRPVGLGIMGWADLLLKCKISYGSKKSIEFAKELAEFFEKEAHKASVALAKEKGTPKCCDYKQLGHRRNVTTISIAPTGSISLLAGCSSSIEPIYSPVTFRYDNTGSYEIPHPDSDKKYFRCALHSEDTSKEVTWKQHIDMQSAFQAHCDSGISKTANMSNSATVEDVKEAYIRAWKSGCKGITIYRDGSKTTQVLNTKSKPDMSAIKRPESVEADIFKARADGMDWHIIIGKIDNTPYELFAVNGKQDLPNQGKIIKKKKRHYSLLSGDDEVLIDNIIKLEQDIDTQVDLETRRFSLELRHGIPPKYICQQIDKSNDVITSFTKVTSRIFKKHYLESEQADEAVLCPQCMNSGKKIEMKFESACHQCPSCHYSKCG